MKRENIVRDYLDPRTGRGPFYKHIGLERANILFISMDMVAPGLYGNTEEKFPVHSPNIDSLRKEGIFFSNAFSTSPLCTPSRASYLTGRYSYITSNSERGHDGHTFHLRDQDSIFPEYLKAVGYHCRHVGKSHVGTHKFMDVFGENDSPWDRWSPPWYDDDEYIGFLKGHGFDRFNFKKSIYLYAA